MYSGFMLGVFETFLDVRSKNGFNGRLHAFAERIMKMQRMERISHHSWYFETNTTSLSINDNNVYAPCMRDFSE